MSTSETVVFSKGPCPCGVGTIAQHVTTQDNPWSSADIHYTIECHTCASKWRLEFDHLVLTSSEAEYRDARNREETSSKPLHALVESLVSEYLSKFAAKSRKAELAEMTRLGISSLTYRQYLEHRAKGKSSAAACYGLRNLTWLDGLAAEQSLEGKLSELIAAYEKAKKETQNASTKIVRQTIAWHGGQPDLREKPRRPVTSTLP